MKLGLGCTVLGIMAALSGCASSRRISDSTRIKEGVGIIVYRMSCGEGVAWAEYHKAEGKFKGPFGAIGRAGVLLCPDGVQSKRLDAGRAAMKRSTRRLSNKSQSHGDSRLGRKAAGRSKPGTRLE